MTPLLYVNSCTDGTGRRPDPAPVHTPGHPSTNLHPVVPPAAEREHRSTGRVEAHNVLNKSSKTADPLPRHHPARKTQARTPVPRPIMPPGDLAATGHAGHTDPVHTLRPVSSASPPPTAVGAVQLRSGSLARPPVAPVAVRSSARCDSTGATGRHAREGGIGHGRIPGVPEMIALADRITVMNTYRIESVFDNSRDHDQMSKRIMGAHRVDAALSGPPQGGYADNPPIQTYFWSR